MRSALLKISVAILLTIGISGLGSSCSNGSKKEVAAVESAPSKRDPRWARPMSRPGLENLHKLNDNLYRGAQPEPEGFAELKKMGVKTIVNLRSMHTDRDDIRKAGLDRDAFNYVRIPLFAWNAKDEHVIEFLKVVTNSDNQPVFFHCQHGADRTGTMAASYRVIVEGWSREDALKEMTEGGYNFHGVWINLVDYMKNLDIEKIKKGAGL